MCRALSIALLCCSAAAAAQGPVYVVLWFDTEDYIFPAADDAALRIAQDLTGLGVRGTFKIVGEKARTLERRGRQDVIRALSLHDIGYHSNFHSRQPTPAVYLNEYGYTDGAAEFERREGGGAEDVRRIFGVVPACYGQPGNSWAPQSYPALRRMGIPVYLDEAPQVGVNEQPFWYSGLLHVFDMGRYCLRASLDPGAPAQKDFAQFDAAAAELEKRGGGLISIYYHPTEFVATEFWDGVNFSHGRNPEPADWKMPHARTAGDAERCFGVLRDYVAHIKQRPGVRFAVARDLPQIYGSPEPPRVDAAAVKKHLREGITFLETPAGALSAGEMLEILLGMEPRFVEGPPVRRTSTWHGATVPRPAFERARRDTAAYIRARGAVPPVIWLGTEYLSPADFIATLAGEDPSASEVEVRKGALAFEKYFADDARAAFRWPIHPDGFNPVALMELARLQGWTLKPARLR